MASHKRQDSHSSYYFIQSPKNTTGVVQEELPPGATSEQFSPKIIHMPKGIPNPLESLKYDDDDDHDDEGLVNAFNNNKPSLFERLSRLYAKTQTNIQDTDKLFVGAQKVDPKVFFSIERTFLAWMHTSLIVAAIALGVNNFADQSITMQMYGLLLNLVAIVFVIYAIVQYAKRNHMILIRSPGPYEDRVGPMVLGSIIVASVFTHWVIKVYYDIEYAY